jgi:hypothetical protein
MEPAVKDLIVILLVAAICVAVLCISPMLFLMMCLVELCRRKFVDYFIETHRNG